MIAQLLFWLGSGVSEDSKRSRKFCDIGCVTGVGFTSATLSTGGSVSSDGTRSWY